MEKCITFCQKSATSNYSSLLVHQLQDCAAVICILFRRIMLCCECDELWNLLKNKAFYNIYGWQAHLLHPIRHKNMSPHTYASIFIFRCLKAFYLQTCVVHKHANFSKCSLPWTYPFTRTYKSHTRNDGFRTWLFDNWLDEVREDLSLLLTSVLNWDLGQICSLLLTKSALVMNFHISPVMVLDFTWPVFCDENPY